MVPLGWRIAILVSTLLLASADAPAQVIISEIMYNPAGVGRNAWEWVELHNPGPEPVDLAGWVFDDDDGDPLEQANVRPARVPPGGFVVLYNADDTSDAIMAQAWGDQVDWVAVHNWPSLSNGGDRLALWSSYASYGARNFAEAVEQVQYDDAPPWPEDDGIASIYLKDLRADRRDGGNWALSALGVDNAYQSQAVPDVGGTRLNIPWVQVLLVIAAVFLVLSLILWQMSRRR